MRRRPRREIGRHEDQQDQPDEEEGDDAGEPAKKHRGREITAVGFIQSA